MRSVIFDISFVILSIFYRFQSVVGDYVEHDHPKDFFPVIVANDEIHNDNADIATLKLKKEADRRHLKGGHGGGGHGGGGGGHGGSSHSHRSRHNNGTSGGDDDKDDRSTIFVIIGFSISLACHFLEGRLCTKNNQKRNHKQKFQKSLNNARQDVEKDIKTTTTAMTTEKLPVGCIPSSVTTAAASSSAEIREPLDVDINTSNANQETTYDPPSYCKFEGSYTEDGVIYTTSTELEFIKPPRSNDFDFDTETTSLGWLIRGKGIDF